MKIVYQSIGIIHSPFTDLAQMPIQPTGDASAARFAEIFPDFVEGLKDINGFSHVILLYHLHQISTLKLVVTPFLDSEPRGVFSTRAPVRPNPIGISVVRLTRMNDNVLHFADLDVLDGTPLLDIKPYIPDFDAPTDVRVGWLENVNHDVRSMKSDDRFT
ncbi:MAG: tRNA (N6-threonylcarbamoyladenosine(37)-N6)-methyltransferase TrmO [Anaerolineaceae bacterium]|nr:tRNA (N6-threonylcarbamoyladenosine(37)-N6)-methyltransferase TrmO [Anaerolineaceae bacterium]